MLSQCMICDFLLSLYQTTSMSCATCHWWCSQRCLALWHSRHNSPLEFFCITWCPDTFGSPHLVSKISFPLGILAVSDWLQQLQDLRQFKFTSSPGEPTYCCICSACLLLVPNWGIWARGRDGATGSCLGALASFPGTCELIILSHLPCSSCLMEKSPGYTYSQASEVFRALWQLPWLICFMVEFSWMISEGNATDAECQQLGAETQISDFLSLDLLIS